jgi:hypothetical protein
LRPSGSVSAVKVSAVVVPASNPDRTPTEWESGLGRANAGKAFIAKDLVDPDDWKKRSRPSG